MAARKTSNAPEAQPLRAGEIGGRLAAWCKLLGCMPPLTGGANADRARMEAVDAWIRDAAKKKSEKK